MTELITDIGKRTVDDGFFMCSSCEKVVHYPQSPLCFDCDIELKYHEIPEEINVYKFNCPICGEKQEGSDYLSSIFSSYKVLWIANMITHYRHHHIKYWDNSVNYISKHLDYDRQKSVVNERCKRNIIRKCRNFMYEKGIKENHFRQLPYNDDSTIKLAEKYLGK